MHMNRRVFLGAMGAFGALVATGCEPRYEDGVSVHKHKFGPGPIDYDNVRFRRIGPGRYAMAYTECPKCMEDLAAGHGYPHTL